VENLELSTPIVTGYAHPVDNAPGREKFSTKKFHSSIFKKVFDKQKTQTQKPKRNERKTKTFFLQSFLFEND
jgi:hypothetical protein